MKTPFKAALRTGSGSGNRVCGPGLRCLLLGSDFLESGEGSVYPSVTILDDVSAVAVLDRRVKHADGIISHNDFHQRTIVLELLFRRPFFGRQQNSLCRSVDDHSLEFGVICYSPQEVREVQVSFCFVHEAFDCLGCSDEMMFPCDASFFSGRFCRCSEQEGCKHHSCCSNHHPLGTCGI